MSTKQLERTTEKKQREQQADKDHKKETSKKKGTTRKELRKQKKLEKKKNRKPRRRIFPIWLRLVVITFLCAFALVVGSMVGFGLLGDGKAVDALKIETWRHIIDIVVKE